MDKYYDGIFLDRITGSTGCVLTGLQDIHDVL